jgi:hypothetical protein
MNHQHIQSPEYIPCSFTVLSALNLLSPHTYLALSMLLTSISLQLKEKCDQSLYSFFYIKHKYEWKQKVVHLEKTSEAVPARN